MVVARARQRGERSGDGNVMGVISTAPAFLGNAQPGGRGQDLDGVLPDHVNWKAHNYAHLVEQPTLFYATVFVLQLAQAATPT